MKFPSSAVVFVCIVLVQCKAESYDLAGLENVPTLHDIMRLSDTPTASINVRCLEQLSYLSEHPDVALTMADAWSKGHAGMKVSSVMDLGHWDECMTIDESGPDNFRLLGKHCVMGLLVPLGDTIQYFATCIPDACTANDFNSVISQLANQSIPLFRDDLCSTTETNTTLDTGAVISLCIFWTVGILMFISTLYDVHLYMYSKKPAHEGMVAFSLVTNGRKLFQTTKNPKQQILCFNGIKLVSMAWIITGHGAVGIKGLPLVNAEFGDKWFDYPYAAYLNAAHLAVDSFFFISGFLLAYSYFKSEYRKPLLVQIGSVPHMYLHRYLRLTPALLMLWLYVTYLSRFVGKGPVFAFSIEGLNLPCHNHWWSIFLYIQNYYNRKELCMTQLWYVSADMQLFILAPLVFIPIALIYKTKPKIAFIVMLILDVFFAVLPIVTRLVFEDYDPEVEEYDTHSRFAGYYIGFTFAMFVRFYRDKFPKIPRIINLAIWCAVLGIMIGILAVYQFSHNSDDYATKALGYQITREVWCVCLCWLVFSCINGQGGPINWFLSNSFMQVTGKLTYSMYLLHGSVLVPFLLTTRGYSYLSDYTAFYAFCGHFIISLIMGTVWTLSFELPMLTVEKIIFSPSVKPVKKDPENNL